LIFSPSVFVTGCPDNQKRPAASGKITTGNINVYEAKSGAGVHISRIIVYRNRYFVNNAG